MSQERRSRDAGGPAAEAAEKVYTEFLGRRNHGEAEDFDALCRVHPALEDALLILHSLHDGRGEPVSAGETRSVSAEPSGRSNAKEIPPRSRPLPGTPERIGPYRILEVLGEGGMGIVYLAEQHEPVRRRVALKVIKLGMDTREVVARFEAERQTLALLDHPGIARMFDAGATEDGRPYFVMEHVPGVPITEYCDRQRLSTRERLDLFVAVCEAVQHAHSNAIIHRDLKPSNVLVMIQDGKPAPKIIDFGVAKATNQRLTEKTVYTEQGRIIGTPEYMSPEQAEMSATGIDARTDIYSLGVLLYELLVGSLPFDPRSLRQAGYAEIQRIIREVEAPKPSTRLGTGGSDSSLAAQRRKTNPRLLVKELRGDLDWITLRALEKDRTRRYTTASELAADVLRHLSHEPVLAGPPSLQYRMQKFVRRNRGLVGALGAVILTLVVGLVASLALYFSAEDARRRADDELVRNEELLSQVKDERDAAQRERDEKERALVAKERALEEKNTALTYSRGLAFTALSSAALADDPRLAFLLALEGAERAPSLITLSNLARVMPHRHERLRLPAHEDPVRWAEFSPDGRRVLTASTRKSVEMGQDSYRWSVRISDAVTGETRKMLEGEYRLGSVSFSPDGSRILVGQEIKLTLFDSVEGKELWSRDWLDFAPSEYPGYARFLPGGQHIYGQCRILDAQTGEILRTLSPEVSSVGGFSLPHVPPITILPGLLLAPVSNNEIAVWDTETGAERLRLTDEGGINTLVASTDGRTALTIRDGKGAPAVVWDLRTGKRLRELKPLHEPEDEWGLRATALTPNGSRAATCDSGQVRLWNVETGEMLRQVQLRGDATQLAFSPDGKRLFAGGSVIDAGSGEVLLEIGGSFGAFSPDGRRIITFHGYQNIAPRIYDASPHESFPLFSGYKGGILSVDFSSGGAQALVLSDAGAADLWDLARERIFRTLRVKDAGVTKAGLSLDGKWAWTVSSDGKVRIWNAADASVLSEIDGHDAVFGPDSRHAVIFRPDGKAQLWDARRGIAPSGDDPVRVTSLDLGPGATATFAPDGKCVLFSLPKKVAGEDETRQVQPPWQVWRLFGESGEPIQVETPPPEGPESPDGEESAPAYHYGERILELWKKPILDPRGRLLVSFAMQSPGPAGPGPSEVHWGLVKAWDLDTGDMLPNMDTPMEGLDSSWRELDAIWRFSPDGRWLLVSTRTNTLGLWDWARESSYGRRILAIGSARKRIEALEQAAEASASTVSIPPIRNPPTDPTEVILFPFKVKSPSKAFGTPSESAGYESPAKRSFVGHTGGIRDAAFSLDSKRLLTASEDGTARVWDVREGKELAVFRAHGAPVLSGSFSPDGSLALTVCGKGTARLWDPATGEERLTLGGDGKIVKEARFAPGGLHVLLWLTESEGQKRKAQLWPIDLLGAARARRPGNFTAEERVRLGLDRIEGVESDAGGGQRP
jgi:WD40 repeat protein/serine/threonine protein kinase